MNKLDKFDEIFKPLEDWLEKHYTKAEMLAITISCTAGLIFLQYQNWMMS
jgi:hypothetical protein